MRTPVIMYQIWVSWPLQKWKLQVLEFVMEPVAKCALDLNCPTIVIAHYATESFCGHNSPPCAATALVMPDSIAVETSTMLFDSTRGAAQHVVN